MDRRIKTKYNYYFRIVRFDKFEEKRSEIKHSISNDK